MKQQFKHRPINNFGVKIIITVLILFCQNIYAQLSLNDLRTFKLGTVFSDTIETRRIINYFPAENKKYTIYKGDFLKTFRIEFENMPFDNYDHMDYCFQFVKDSLVSLELNRWFGELDVPDFSRLLKQINLDLSNKYARINDKYNMLNIDNIITAAENECKANTYLKERLLGRSVWSVDAQNSTVANRILLEIFLESGSITYDGGFGEIHRMTTYKGTRIIFKVVLTNPKTNTLYASYEKNKDEYTYKSIETESEYINQHGKNKPKFLPAGIQLKEEGGVYKVPVNLNGVMTLDFILDLGASDVSISPDVFLVLVKSGTIASDDYIGSETYQFADGSTAKSAVINLKTLTIGNKVLQNVRASVSKSLDAPLLLGQSAMKKLTNYKIDVENKILIIE
jgi:aspartyl protease family protein